MIYLILISSLYAQDSLEKLSSFGITLKDPITLEEVSNLSEKEEEFISEVIDFANRLEEIPENLSPFTNNQIKPQFSYEDLYKDLQENNTCLKSTIHSIPTFIVELYADLKTYLDQVYFENETGTIERKNEALIRLLGNAWKNEGILKAFIENTEIPDLPPSNSKGWHDESLYKVARVYLQNKSEDDKKLAAQQYMSGGRNCPDAQKSAINNTYNTLCEKSSIEIEVPSTYLQRAQEQGISSEIALTLFNSWQSQISALLNASIQKELQGKAEQLTPFQNTWDKLAPFLGLNKLGAKYPGFQWYLPKVYELVENNYPKVVKEISKDLKENPNFFSYPQLKNYLSENTAEVLTKVYLYKMGHLGKKGSVKPPREEARAATQDRGGFHRSGGIWRNFHHDRDDMLGQIGW